jgi:hypothetical protein
VGLSHLCVDCGLDLRHERSAIEPHYGLPLVICPRCGCAAVRRRHPFVRAWPNTRRFICALRTILIQSALIAFLSALMLQACGDLSRTMGLYVPFGRRSLIDLLLHEWSSLIGWGLVPPIMVGAWLTCGLGHLGRTRAFLLWSGWIVFLVHWTTLIDWSPGRLEVLVTQGASLIPRRVDELLPKLAAAVVLMVIALAGIPLGVGLQRYGRLLRRRGWRALRRRRRRVRTRPVASMK